MRVALSLVRVRVRVRVSIYYLHWGPGACCCYFLLALNEYESMGFGQALFLRSVFVLTYRLV